MYRCVRANLRDSGSGARYRCIGVSVRTCAVRGLRARYGLGAAVSMCSKLARHARHMVDAGLGFRVAIVDNSGVYVGFRI